MRSYLATLLVGLAVALAPPALAQPHNSSGAIVTPRPVLWRDPGDIRSRDLFYGPGGKQHQPQLPVTFEKEDRKGSSPKFDVRDANGKKWKAKLGYEARPETAATRLLWAVGYTANENYLVPDLKVEGLPAQLTRGAEYRMKNGDLRDVRLQHRPDPLGTWSWRNNPFSGTREFNGLRVMMALLDNWDLKDANNARLEDKKTGETVYEVTDVGASFGPPGRRLSETTKGSLKVYRHTRFITKVRKNDVDFSIVKAPGPFFMVFDFPYFFMELHRRWIGKHIPREDAKWIGSLLAQLSPGQIRDAFRAAGYPPDEIEGFASVVQSRIAELQQL